MEQSNSSSSFADDLENLDDSEIVTYCITKLKEMKCEDHLKWLQQQFCDVAYAKCGKIWIAVFIPYLLPVLYYINCGKVWLAVFIHLNFTT